MTTATPRRLRPAIALAVAAVLVLGSCSSGGSDDDSGSSKADDTAAPAAEPLSILVSNDDGYAAPGLDEVVEELRKVEGVEVTVVAPLEQQSGTGGSTTDGEVAVTDVETASGYPAKAVDGYPADAVRVAFEELDVQPDLVVTGINSIQNVGPAIDSSGTIGAAREGVAQGVPALATSQGRGSTEEAADYPAAIPFILDWIEEHRDDLASGDAAAEVTSLNVPSCESGGEVRGLLEVPPATGGDILAVQDCTSTTAESDLTDDVTALNDGFATIGVIPSVPAGG